MIKIQKILIKRTKYKIFDRWECIITVHGLNFYQNEIIAFGIMAKSSLQMALLKMNRAIEKEIQFKI